MAGCPKPLAQPAKLRVVRNMEIFYGIVPAFCAAGLVALIFKSAVKNCDDSKACVFTRGFLIVLSGVITGSTTMKLYLG